MSQDIDSEFGEHTCSVCGTDCQTVSDTLEEKDERIAKLTAEVEVLTKQRDGQQACATHRAGTIQKQAAIIERLKATRTPPQEGQ